MVAQFIDMISLMELCKETERTPGAQAGMFWYLQLGIYLAGDRDMAAAEADEDGREK